MTSYSASGYFAKLSQGRAGNTLDAFFFDAISKLIQFCGECRCVLLVCFGGWLRWFVCFAARKLIFVEGEAVDDILILLECVFIEF